MNESLVNLGGPIEVGRVDIEPGDVVVVRHPRKLEPEEEAALAGVCSRVFPKNQILILDEGATLDIVGMAS